MANFYYNGTLLFSIEVELDDTMSFIPDETTIIDDVDDWDSDTLVEEDVLFMLAIGHIEELVRMHEVTARAHQAEAPVLRAVDDHSTGVLLEFWLDEELEEAMTPNVQEHITRARRQEYHTSMIPPVRHRNETLNGFMLRLGVPREYNTHYMLGEPG
ncbi:hypothetical protein H2200_010689 [Cladophialophora chaetospira]|uniref:Uncharacterized protein n=1 Tax=Cladophialophora chaetospira TaxID=386627 RepID=A0AA38X0J6_9EURO|nr:hypothetical protein H2200_010689 [Cladophialophora chaetospira]